MLREPSLWSKSNSENLNNKKTKNTSLQLNQKMQQNKGNSLRKQNKLSSSNLDMQSTRQNNKVQTLSTLVLNYSKEKLRKLKKNLDMMKRKLKNKAKKWLIPARNLSKMQVKKSVNLVTKKMRNLLSKVRTCWMSGFLSWKIRSIKFKKNWTLNPLKELIQVIRWLHLNLDMKSGL